MKKDPKKESLIALKKARTHIDKIISMIEGDYECIEIIQQIKAVTGLLKSASQTSLKVYLSKCLEKSSKCKDNFSKQAIADEIAQIITLLNK